VRGELPADWLEALALMARQTRHAYLRHPWSIHLVQEQGAVGAALAGPNGLRHLEQSLSALSGAPMDARTKLDVLAIVDDYVTGHVIRAAGKTSDAAAAAPGPEAGGNADFIQSQLASGDFPQLATVVGTEDVAGFTDPADLDARFELGLRLLLTGITAQFR
jgi:tetracycline repressor-like protein